VKEALRSQRCSSKLRTKLHNTFYAKAEVKREKGKEYFRYAVIEMLSSFDFEKFLDAIEAGAVAVDFDARTGHNHGTKFRLTQNWLPALYVKSVHL